MRSFNYLRPMVYFLVFGTMPFLCGCIDIEKKTLVLLIPPDSNKIHMYYVFEGISVSDSKNSTLELAKNQLIELKKPDISFFFGGNKTLDFMTKGRAKPALKHFQFEPLRFYNDVSRKRKLCAERPATIVDREEFTKKLNGIISALIRDHGFDLIITSLSKDFFRPLLDQLDKKSKSRIKGASDPIGFEWFRIEGETLNLVLPITQQCAKKILANPKTAKWQTKMQDFAKPFRVQSCKEGLALVLGEKGKAIRFTSTSSGSYRPHLENNLIRFADPQPILIAGKAATAATLIDQFVKIPKRADFYAARGKPNSNQAEALLKKAKSALAAGDHKQGRLWLRTVSRLYPTTRAGKTATTLLEQMNGIKTLDKQAEENDPQARALLQKMVEKLRKARTLECDLKVSLPRRPNQPVVRLVMASGNKILCFINLKSLRPTLPNNNINQAMFISNGKNMALLTKPSLQGKTPENLEQFFKFSLAKGDLPFILSMLPKFFENPKSLFQVQFPKLFLSNVAGVTLRKEEKIGKRNAQVVEFKNNAYRFFGGRTFLWIDNETSLPVKYLHFPKGLGINKYASPLPPMQVTMRVDSKVDAELFQLRPSPEVLKRYQSWRDGKFEKAQEQLLRAKDALSKGGIFLGKLRLKSLIRQYPHTSAAEEAGEILKSLEKKE